ncbi:MAG: hypothetical protein PUE61_10910 [Clostridiales bacterium]|nr:hypothetical protein [Clostridiales bacterium]
MDNGIFPFFRVANQRINLHFYGKYEKIENGRKGKRGSAEIRDAIPGVSIRAEKGFSPVFPGFSPFFHSPISGKSQENQGFAEVFHFSTAPTTTTKYIEYYYYQDWGATPPEIKGDLRYAFSDSDRRNQLWSWHGHPRHRPKAGQAGI